MPTVAFVVSFAFRATVLLAEAVAERPGVPLAPMSRDPGGVISTVRVELG